MGKRWRLIRAVSLALPVVAAFLAGSALALEQQHPAVTPPPSRERWVRIVSPTADGARETRDGAVVVWVQRPTAQRIGGLYPQQALHDGVGGWVELHCTVLTDLSAACSVAREFPAGHGFGQAALSASVLYRARPTLSDGTSAVGAQARVVVRFYAPH